MAWWPPKNSRWDTESSGAIIASEGGNETRPKCLTVNIFIKTKESAPGGAAQSIPEITPEALREMIRRPEIRGEIETIFRELIRGNH